MKDWGVAINTALITGTVGCAAATLIALVIGYGNMAGLLGGLIGLMAGVLFLVRATPRRQTGTSR